jgi:hypothetical protein
VFTVANMYGLLFSKMMTPQNGFAEKYKTQNLINDLIA